MTSAIEIKRHYENNFDAEYYRQMITNRDGGKFRKEEEFFFRAMKKIFDNPEFRGNTLLDIGSGPTVHNLVPACPYYSRITLSEFVESSRQELKKWLQGDPNALDWSRLLCEAAKIQGYEDPEQGREEIEVLIRQKVKHVIFCDVLADPIVPQEYNRTYDLVMTSLTIEAAAPDYHTFKSCLKKINSLVKIRGHLVMKGFLQGSIWKTGDHKFPYLSLTQKQIEEALEEADFGNIVWQTMKKQDVDFWYNFDSCYCLCCVKLKEQNPTPVKVSSSS